VAAAALDDGPDDELDDAVGAGVLLLDDELLDGLLVAVEDGAVDGALLLDDDDELDEDVDTVVDVDGVELDVGVLVGGVSQPVTRRPCA
jgi:hypothetical protein